MIRKKPTRWDTTLFKEKVLNISPDIQVLGEYIKMDEHIECMCLNCGYVWDPLAGNIIRGTKCPQCQKMKIGKTKKAPRHNWDAESFKQKILEISPNIELLEEFVKTSKKIKCRCRICKTEWTPYANNLLKNRSKCPKCSVNRNRLTEQEFLQKAHVVNESVEILGKFCGTQSRIKCRCKKCGNIWEPVASSILLGRQCRKCAYLENREKLKYSHQEFVEKLSNLNPNIIVIGKYEDIYTKIKCQCSICNHQWLAVPHNLLSGRSCPSCNHSSTSYIEKFILYSFQNFLGEDKVISRNKSAIGEELDIYIPSLKCAFEPGSWKLHEKKLNQDSKKQKLCKEAGIKLITIYYDFDGPKFNDESIITYNKDLALPNNNSDLITLVNKLFEILSLKNNFLKQDWDNISNLAYINSRKMTTEQFAEQLVTINKNIQILDEYKNGHTKIRCKCKVCNSEWQVTPQDLLAGRGCPNCYNLRRGNTLRHSQSEFNKLVESKNPNIQVLGDYVNSKTPIKCLCKKCGYEWEPVAGRLINSKANGCPKCAGTQKLTTEIFIQQIKQINPNIEILGEYVNNETKIGCLCKQCGLEWFTTPHILKGRHGCPHCSKFKNSK